MKKLLQKVTASAFVAGVFSLSAIQAYAATISPQADDANLDKAYEYVDLGLPSGTLWATCNVGAESPYEYGDHFAWAEIEPKTYYSESTYKYYDTSNGTYTKYGLSDNKKFLDNEDDAAYMIWGPDWITPTHAQQKELLAFCIFNLITVDDKYVVEVTGPNGKILYFPLSGNYTDGQIELQDEVGSYWSHELEEFDITCANDIDIWKDSQNINNVSLRYHGQSVRPVYNDGSTAEDIDFTNRFVADNVTVRKGESSKLNINLSSAAEIFYSGFQFDMSMPESITFNEASLGQTLTDAGFLIVSSDLGNNTVRIMVYNTSGKSIAEKENLVEISISASADTYVGDRNIYIFNSLLSTPTGSEKVLDDSELRVYVEGIQVAGIEIQFLEGDQDNLTVGGYAAYRAYITPENAENQSVSWTIADPEIADIAAWNDQTVMVYPKTTGETVLRAIANDHSGVTADITITVVPFPVKEVNFHTENWNYTVYCGETIRLEAEVNGDAEQPIEYEWSIGITDLASIKDFGEYAELTGMNPGILDVTLKAWNASGSAEVTIPVSVEARQAESVEISGPRNDMKVTEKMKLTAVVYPSHTTYQDLEWHSSDENILSIDQEGNVTANNIGYAFITVIVKETPYVQGNFEICVNELILGDANDNGNVNVADVTTIANYIVNLPVDNIREICADADQSGEIDVNDITKTVSIIMGGASTRSSMESLSEIFMPHDHLIISRRTRNTRNSENGISFCLANTVSYSAIQADIIIPTGVTVENVAVGARSADDSIVYNMINDSTLRVLVYSTENKPFIESSESLFDITVSGEFEENEIKTSNVFASDSSSTRFTLSEECDIKFAGISDIEDGQLSVNATMGGIKVLNGSNKEVRIFTMDGRESVRLIPTSEYEFVALAPGIYIVVVNNNSWKVLIR